MNLARMVANVTAMFVCLGLAVLIGLICVLITYGVIWLSGQYRISRK